MPGEILVLIYGNKTGQLSGATSSILLTLPDSVILLSSTLYVLDLLNVTIYVVPRILTLSTFKTEVLHTHLLSSK